MGVFFYSIFLALFKVIVRVAALFSPKAKKWVAGRRNIFERLEKAIGGGGPIVWMHCASLGEFEQGRPLLEKLRTQYPTHQYLLTFFSPSGYEVRKNYDGADWVFYLPMDGASNARRFLDIVKPELVIFVKYEFWYYYLKKIKYRQIPLILVSALFWEKMSFFKWYGALQRKMLSRFDHLFVQDKTSQQLISHIGLGSITSISGDTRFDRVIDIASKAVPIPVIESFLQQQRVIIAGSTWPEDENILKAALAQVSDTSLKLIIAPHEINDKHLGDLREQFPEAVFYSELIKNPGTISIGARVLVIDNIGLLSRLYRYGFVSYIGGGFGKGIHNTLEAAVYGRPVFFGPVFHKFREAKELILSGGAITIHDALALAIAINDLISDENKFHAASNAAKDYVLENRGATDKIIRYIQEKRLLTN